MRTSRLVAAALAGVVVCLVAAASPPGPAMPDGTYLGYVRKLPDQREAVGVDVVQFRDGVAADDDPAEVTLDAGLLASTGLVTGRPRPFRIVVKRGEIVQLTQADDVLPTRPEPRR